MTVEKILVGNAVKWTGSYTDELGAAIDPTVATFTLRAPDLSETVYTFNDDEELVRDEEGEYHIWLFPGVIPDQLGEYTGFFVGSGNIGVRGCATVEMVDECT